MKRLIGIFLSLCFLMSAFPLLTLATASPAVNVSVNGKLLAFTADTGAPFVDEANRTQVPLRATMEALGVLVEWDAATKTVNLTKDSTTVLVPVGVSHIIVNGTAVPTDTAARIVSNRTYLPIRAVAEAFSASVYWNQNTRTVLINPSPRQMDRSYYSLYNDLLDQICANPSAFYEDPYGNLSDNQSALADINGDGIDDLFVCFLDTNSAATYTAVYSYNPDSGTLYRMGILGAHCKRVFASGLVFVGDNTNQSLGQSIWPYTVSQFSKGSFQDLAHFSSWEKGFSPDESKPFPHSLDKDKDGILYIRSNFNGQETCMDGKEYQQALNTLLQGSAEIQMIWHPMA